MLEKTLYYGQLGFSTLHSSKYAATSWVNRIIENFEPFERFWHHRSENRVFVFLDPHSRSLAVDSLIFFLPKNVFIFFFIITSVVEPTDDADLLTFTDEIINENFIFCPVPGPPQKKNILLKKCLILIWKKLIFQK